MSTFNLAYVALDAGDFDRARALMGDALEGFSATGDRLGIARVHAGFAAAAVHAGAFDEAIAPLHRSLELCRELGARETGAWPLELLGCARAAADPGTAARFLGSAETMRRGLGLRLEGSELVAHDAAVERVRDVLSPATLERAWADGAALSFEDALEEALADTAP